LKVIDYSAGSLQTVNLIEISRWLGILIRATVRDRHDLALENLALRQPLGVLKRGRAFRD
jgi:hypothetical protein